MTDLKHEAATVQEDGLQRKGIDYSKLYVDYAYQTARVHRRLYNFGTIGYADPATGVRAPAPYRIDQDPAHADLRRYADRPDHAACRAARQRCRRHRLLRSQQEVWSEALSSTLPSPYCI